MAWCVSSARCGIADSRIERVLGCGDDAEYSRPLHTHRGRLPAAANLGAIRPLPIPRVGAPHLKVLDTCGSAAHDIKAHTLWKVGSKEKQRRVERFDKVCVRIRTESRTKLPSPLLRGGALAEARLPVLACNRHLHGGVGLQGMRQFAHAHLHVRHKLVEQTLMLKLMLALHATLSGYRPRHRGRGCRVAPPRGVKRTTGQR
eukprot:scaffold113272_cov66-Phaeocystis_antarctica.AAC.3